jgi:glycosyltransferase involved in cell wall biosynthesis
MMSEEPLLSIIIPSFNQGKYIGETLHSIFNQDYRPIEVLVLDGGSTDETLRVLRSFDFPELQWWSQPDRGVVEAVNKGLRRAQGEILAIQSSDDAYLPGAFSTVVSFLRSREDVALVYGDVEYMDVDSQITGRTSLPPFDLCGYLGKFSYIPQPSAFFRAWAASEVGGWREDISYAADAEYWLRIALRYPVAKIDKLVGRYRYHYEQRDKQVSKVARDWGRAVQDLLREKKLDRPSRRFARMGIHLTNHHYTPESRWTTRTRYLYQAALANPVGIINSHFPKRELLIGREPLWKFLSRIKRMMGFQPRTS